MSRPLCAKSTASTMPMHTAHKPLMPVPLLGKKVARRLREVLNLIAKQTDLHRENLSKPPKPKPKPHKHMAQKP